MANALTDCPYRGLVPFEEGDARYFRGRSKETRLVVANLCTTRLTLLYGASGVGKTSLLRAGVIPRFKTPQYDSNLVVYFNKWKGDPLINLRLEVIDAIRTADVRAKDGRNLSVKCLQRVDYHSSALNSFWKFLAVAGRLLQRRLVIILDQFDEFFLYHPAPEGANFVSELAATLTKTKGRVTVLLSLREDTLSDLDRFKGEVPFLFDNYLRVDHLNRDAARAAITEPLEEYRFPTEQDQKSQSVTIEPELVEEILQDLGPTFERPGTSNSDARTSGANSLIKAPYLQLVMTRLWQQDVERARRRVLSRDTLRKLGGVKRIISTHLDEVLRQLSWPQKSLAARVFPYLVASTGGKRAETAEQLAYLARKSPKKTIAVLERLETLRILDKIEVREIDGSTQENYEIYHDYLAQPILTWLRTHRRRVRTVVTLFLISSPAIVMFPAFLSVFEPTSDNLFFAFGLFTLFELPLILGFFVGRWWMSVR